MISLLWLENYQHPGTVFTLCIFSTKFLKITHHIFGYKTWKQLEFWKKKKKHLEMCSPTNPSISSHRWEPDPLELVTMGSAESFVDLQWSPISHDCDASSSLDSPDPFTFSKMWSMGCLATLTRLVFTLKLGISCCHHILNYYYYWTKQWARRM